MLNNAREKFPNLKSMDIEYFTFHREVEEHQEEEMANVLEEYINYAVPRQKFNAGGGGMLGKERDFWMGLTLKN